MLKTEAIANAFEAICQEIEKLKNEELPEHVRKHLKTVVSIAKHQSDIRNAPEGGCKAHK